MRVLHKLIFALSTILVRLPNSCNWFVYVFNESPVIFIDCRVNRFPFQPSPVAAFF